MPHSQSVLEGLTMLSLVLCLKPNFGILDFYVSQVQSSNKIIFNKAKMEFLDSTYPTQSTYNIFKARLVFMTHALTNLLQGAYHDPGNGG